MIFPAIYGIPNQKKKNMHVHEFYQFFPWLSQLINLHWVRGFPSPNGPGNVTPWYGGNDEDPRDRGLGPTWEGLGKGWKEWKLWTFATQNIDKNMSLCWLFSSRSWRFQWFLYGNYDTTWSGFHWTFIASHCLFLKPMCDAFSWSQGRKWPAPQWRLCGFGPPLSPH